MAIYSLDKLVNQARRLAAEYRRATGKPLPVGAEIARHDAARLLGLELQEAQGTGFDAIGRGARAGRRFQIKGRALFPEQRSSPRIGQLGRPEDWDALLLVLMDENFEPTEIYEAEREAVQAALAEASARRSRGALSVARVKAIGRRVWRRRRIPPTADSAPAP